MQVIRKWYDSCQNVVINEENIFVALQKYEAKTG